MICILSGKFITTLYITKQQNSFLSKTSTMCSIKMYWNPQCTRRCFVCWGNRQKPLLSRSLHSVWYTPKHGTDERTTTLFEVKDLNSFAPSSALSFHPLLDSNLEIHSLKYSSVNEMCSVLLCMSPSVQWWGKASIFGWVSLGVMFAIPALWGLTNWGRRLFHLTSMNLYGHLFTHVRRLLP